MAKNKKSWAISKFFRYIEHIWLGVDGKMSVRATLAIAFSIDFISNTSHAVYKWDAGRPLEGLALVLGIEAGLITALLSITAWNNVSVSRINAEASAIPSDPTIKVQNVENVNVTQKPKDGLNIE